MITTTKAQRVAIAKYARRMELPYKQVRLTIRSTYGCDGAVVLPYYSMFICIERDGYAHS
jgi:hypothetical protein